MKVFSAFRHEEGLPWRNQATKVLSIGRWVLLHASEAALRQRWVRLCSRPNQRPLVLASSRIRLLILWKSERVCVCVYLCVCERERERDCVYGCMYEKETVCRAV